MREVLFRGQRVSQKLTEKGEWVYGAFIPDPKEALEGHVCGAGFIWQWDPETRRKKVFAVSRNTVGQWTGLTDRDGVRIFEGDIVTGFFDYEKITGVVVYGSDASFFIDRKGTLGIGMNNVEDWAEVAGNVYDNPELLEVET